MTTWLINCDYWNHNLSNISLTSDCLIILFRIITYWIFESSSDWLLRHAACEFGSSCNPHSAVDNRLGFANRLVINMTQLNLHHHLQMGCPSEKTSYGHFSRPPASKDAGRQKFCAIKKRNKAPAKAMLAQITIMTNCYFLGKIFENVQ